MAESDLDIAIITATAERLAEKIKPRADEAKKKFRYMRWLKDDDGRDHGSEYCTECVDEAAETEPHGLRGVRGWNETAESDFPRYCDKCGCPLHASLTSFGIHEFFDGLIEDEYKIDGSDWYFMPELLAYTRKLLQNGYAREVLSLFEKLEAIDG